MRSHSAILAAILAATLVALTCHKLAGIKQAKIITSVLKLSLKDA
jgi:hypothetical protein